jgi:hypothetical protein
MENMKMSEVFDGLPVSIDESGDCHYFLQDKTDKLDGANCGEFYGEAIGKAVVHAINNHDRLVEENAELREAVKFLVSEDELRDLDKNSKHWKLIDKLLNK